MMPGPDRFQGCILGLALGDALGAPFEGGIVEKALWRWIGSTRTGQMRWTDDTQMSLDILESLLATGGVDQDDLAARFAKSYRWSRGYGPGTAKILKRIAKGSHWRNANRSVHKAGSFGNGAAMRAPIVGVFYANRADLLVEAARQSAEVTHAHPLGVEGAVAVACATALAAHGQSGLEIFQETAARCTLEPFTSRLATARAWLESDKRVSGTEVRRELGNGIAAHESSVTAIYLAMRYRDRPFDEMHQFITQLGGDVDTIGAMAGAVWGVANGAASLPAKQLARLEQRERLANLAVSLYERAAQDDAR
jgi:poly(ADP-ribose) glycohydrolase ARH3